MTTSLYKIEHHASKIYTLEIFKEVKHEIEECGTLNVIERLESGDKLMFRLNKYCNPTSEVSVVNKGLVNLVVIVYFLNPATFLALIFFVP